MSITITRFSLYAAKKAPLAWVVSPVDESFHHTNACAEACRDSFMHSCCTRLIAYILTANMLVYYDV